ncbi:hypothetical protein LTR64_003684 [Lithohypha guttulata]|uniref:uncharacterized protein n=1 Tax=Lithohypha guttulata TaxID=1690604 RepID=UPI002DDF89DE|nr:hypothetical protein LTR51_000096 [Lithohypha guttulata]
MPYVTTAIPRPEEITGTSTLPLARVKKIIAQDEDISQASNSAAFAISVATEEFLRYLTEQAFNVAKSEAKPRKNIQYKDIAAAVSKLDNLQFLSDVVPRTITYKQVKEKDQKVKDGKDTTTNGTNGHEAEEGDEALTSKQRSIAHMMGHPHAHTNGNHGMSESEPMSPAQQRISLSMATSPIVDRPDQPQRNGHAHPSSDADDDVEMDD